MKESDNIILHDAFSIFPSSVRARARIDLIERLDKLDKLETAFDEKVLILVGERTKFMSNTYDYFTREVSFKNKIAVGLISRAIPLIEKGAQREITERDWQEIFYINDALKQYHD